MTNRYTFIEDGVTYIARNHTEFVQQLSFGRWFHTNDDPKNLDAYMYQFSQRVKNMTNLDVNWNSPEHFVRSLVDISMIEVFEIILN